MYCTGSAFIKLVDDARLIARGEKTPGGGGGGGVKKKKFPPKIGKKKKIVPSHQPLLENLSKYMYV